MSQYQIDPKLPKGFQSTPNNERSKAHLAAWWDVPYIETWTVDKEEEYTRMHQRRINPHLTADEIDAKVVERRAAFLAGCPSGTSYTVHCLDGGAWDRPTLWGSFESLEEALDCCENGPSWRRLNPA